MSNVTLSKLSWPAMKLSFVHFLITIFEITQIFLVVHAFDTKWKNFRIQESAQPFLETKLEQKMCRNNVWGNNSVHPRVSKKQRRWTGLAKFGAKGDEEDEVRPNTNEKEEDWRSFRARLVRSEYEGMESDEYNPFENFENEGGNWAYDTKGFVERGYIVLSVPSSDITTDIIDSLTNQCYRKSIILVLKVRSDFISGIVLNRPTNIIVHHGMKLVRPNQGEINYEEAHSVGQKDVRQWKVWFGGEVGGPYSDNPLISCLHSVTTELGEKLSDIILPGLLMTSFEGAETLVQAGEASPSDFWLFCGICGWEKSSFEREMSQEGIWRVVSSGRDTIMDKLNLLRCEKELATQEYCDVDSDPRNAGLHTWEILMNMIGHGNEANESIDSFGDLVLKQWATEVLSFFTRDDESSNAITNKGGDFDLSEYDPASSMTGILDPYLSPQLPASSGSTDIIGTLIRASSAKISPFLFHNQYFHKSIILILHDDDECSEGIILNHITGDKIELDPESGVPAQRDVTKFDLAVRYGGPLQSYSAEENVDNDRLSLLLHANDLLREANVGIPVGKSGIYLCSEREVCKSLTLGLASPDDFMAVVGRTIWRKDGSLGGVKADIEEGYFEVVPISRNGEVWRTLQSQKALCPESLNTNLSLSDRAWHIAGRRDEFIDASEKNDGLYVFGSDVDVSSLADEALRRWVTVFLL